MNIHLIAVQDDADADSTVESLLLLLSSAGHSVSGPEIVQDNPQGIRAALDGAIRASRAQCVLVCSGAPHGIRDAASDVVSDSIERTLPGIGEQIRKIAQESEDGCPALSRACGGIASHTLVVSIPASQSTQEDVVRRVILPALKHLALSTSTDSDGLTQTTLSQPVARGWQAAVEALGGTLVHDAWPTLPSALADRAAVRAVFDTAGQRGVLACPNRRRYAVFGFPVLQRPTSKVLLTADGGRADYIVALHRYPDPVGILGPGAPDLLTSHDTQTRQVCREIVGAPITDDGFSVFAVDRGQVFLERDGAIGAWDGREFEDEGLPSQIGASLVLRWSQR